MKNSIPRIPFPELFFGFVAPIGADISDTLQSFKSYFEARKYDVVEIKVTDIFPAFATYHAPEKPLLKRPLQKRYETHIAYGNQLRATFGDETLAVSAICRVIRQRLRLNRADDAKFSKTVFLMHQFKRKEEIELLRSVYGRLFFQVSIYSRRGARVDYLSRKFANSENSADARSYRSGAEALIQRDEDERGVGHGQRVGKIFHDADFIISLDDRAGGTDKQVERFCDLIFSSNATSPTRTEYGLFVAKAAAMQSLDLSRQVGAAIFGVKGEVIALGSNEVPKAGGGSYWPHEEIDDREYKRGFDSNDKRKQELLAELIGLIKTETDRPDIDARELAAKKSIRDSQFMGALEYGRIVHAEMSAICDAARVGRALENAVLYCTTFPCHMCAKHIIASGIKKVIFLEPYPKSLASELHCDALEIEGEDRGSYSGFPTVVFEHFHGVTPRRYRELFEREKRKGEHGEFIQFGRTTGDAQPTPVIDIKAPFYTQLEEIVLSHAADELIKAIELRENGSGAETC
ncbi:anti-phage dCTP deaminase [Methylosinus sp. LW3]|uniref:anti-phage dCTP deaminase n=1 Tax=Methylosinus sp. LW3 TaxID=107635 RepID=UPI0004AC5C68|nr:anti-phage dCTP deaminase [Methylosinus sp. LW3]